MASYKVIQDIEAEDKLLGPLTLRQFIYAAVAVLCFYLSFLVISKGVGAFALVFLPVGFVSGFFAWPWSRDQPTEIWALAKIRFMLKPRKRIWNQSGTKELVTVTAPKRVEVNYTNGLSQLEVESRLKALADMIDSRGWATKNVNINLYNAQPAAAPASDRLVSASALPAAVDSVVDIREGDDMLEDANPVAQQFDSMIAASTKAHREEILEHLREPAPNISAATAQPTATPPQANNSYWFLNQPGATAQVPQDAVTFNTQVITPGIPVQPAQAQAAAPVDTAVTPAEEQALIEKLRQQEALENSVNPYGHYHTIQPISAAQGQQVGVTQLQNAAMQPPAQQPIQYPFSTQPQTTAQAANTGVQQNQQTAAQQVTQAPDPAILQLASNDDLDVATIAREANKRKELQDEVVISLH